MRVKKYEGATMRDAIAKVKADLGDHAVIIATRDIRRGLLGSAVEISAAIDDDDVAPAPPAPAHATGPEPRLDLELEKLVGPLRTELRSLRAMVRSAGDNRSTLELRAELVALRKLVEDNRRPAPAPAAVRLPARALRTDALLVAPSAGRVVMLVGPTGAGKTTTIAKLAARASLIEQRSVGLITLDNYRVGGVDQIRTFAELIGVPLQVADSPGALRDTIDPTDELTLVDTAGRSPRDTDAIAELAEHIAGLGIEVHLAVPAATTPALIDQLVARYRPLGLTRLLFTKVDEIDVAADLALAPGRTGLPITWITTGQAVPEDIEEPTAPRLLELAAHGLALATPHRGRAA